jgi:hypothetical protein
MREGHALRVDAAREAPQANAPLPNETRRSDYRPRCRADLDKPPGGNSHGAVRLPDERSRRATNPMIAGVLSVVGFR